MPYLILILLLAALVLLWIARRQRKASGLPSGRIIYSDTRQWGPLEKPLYDPAWRLTGRPDYLIQRKDQRIPVEVKSTPIGAAPYDSHIYQLAAYCRLVEVEYGVRPSYGILHYPNRTFAVDYTPQLEAALFDLIQEMRQSERQGSRGVIPARSHDSAMRCSRCGYRSICEQLLR